MTPLQQAAQELVDRIADLGASPLDWAEYTALEKALEAKQAQAVEAMKATPEDMAIYRSIGMNTPLQTAAQAVIERWDSPLWKDQSHTGVYISDLRKALSDEQAQAMEPVAWMHEGTLGRYFNENRNDVHSKPLYCAPMTHDSDFIQIPVAYQYAYPDGVWRCSYGDEINGGKPITSRALYARKDGK